MGWFLTKNNKKKRAKPRARRSAAAKPWDPQRTLLGLKILAGVCTVAATVWAWRVGEPWLRDYATQKSLRANGDHDGVIHVHLVDAPSWLEPGSLLRQEMVTLVARQLSPDPFNALDLDQAVHALRTSPWVKDVHRIERVAVDEVRVHAQYRTPTALLHTRNGYHLIDNEGVRLLELPYAQRPQTNLPVIAGVAHAAPALGEPWAGDDVQAALNLVRMLETRPYFDQIDAIDVSERDRRGRIRMRIQATNGGEIAWGFPPGEENVTERDAAFKLANIDEHYRRFNVIAMPRQVVEVYNEVVLIRTRN